MPIAILNLVNRASVRDEVKEKEKEKVEEEEVEEEKLP